MPTQTQAPVADLHRRACQSTRGFIAGILPRQWSNPCQAEDDVRGLVKHLAGGQLMTVAMLHGQAAAAPPDLGHDPLAAYDAACAQAQAAWEEPGALDRVCDTGHGEYPATVWAGIRIMDVFVHGWDLAVATGQDDTLAPDFVAAIYDEWKPREEMLRHSGMFAEPPEVPNGADLQTQMLALFGRARGGIRAQELGHVGMYVRDLAASVRFYRDLIGFGESGRVPGTVFLTSGRSHHELALIEPGPEAVSGPRQPAFGLNHLAIKVGDSTEDLRRAHRRVVQAGIAITDASDFTIQQGIQIEDPDGTVVELYIDTGADWRDPRVMAQALPKPLQF